MKLYDGGVTILIVCALIGSAVGLRSQFKEPQIAVTQPLGEGRSITCYVPQSQVTKDTTCVREKV